MSGVPISANSDRIAAVARLRKEHSEAAFPKRLTYDDVAGVEMVMLDADIMGCVTGWQDSDGNLEDWRWNILAAREHDLERVLPKLSGQEAAYYQELLDMAVLILGSPDDRSRG
ncbi:hypothetical protein M1L60_46120 [Actinoplanes sp. TRM 88003]|uniref:Uncharacterized protein n=1 Tax=Paractinoplanes aksuensis TaxID=2939490 RepID=A0ABT1E4B0_9ACTN|nr:hypothetical protein [Actinoplanes aksuensis]MCO8277974.1 hypothetical protein [Actinoplanes aksuensis]